MPDASAPVAPHVAALNVGLPVDHGQTEVDDVVSGTGAAPGGLWRSGIFKHPIDGPVFLSTTGFEGDGQADLVNHGGNDKAVCAYAAGHYPDWRQSLGLDPFPFGAFGENLTLAGLDEHSACIGDVWSVGDAVLQVSQPRQPCWKLARKWAVESLPHEVRDSGRTGWYFRVLQEGRVTRGCRLELIDRRHGEWTVAAANAVMHTRTGDVAALAALDVLSASWRESLGKRVTLASPPT